MNDVIIYDVFYCSYIVIVKMIIILLAKEI